MESLSEKITFLNQTTLECFTRVGEINILEKFTEAGIKVMGSDFGFAWIKNHNLENFELAYKSPSVPYEPLAPRHAGSSETVMENKQPLLLSNYPDTKYFRPDAGNHIQALAVIPITYKDEIYGSIFICFKNPYIFKPEDESLCAFIGNSAAQAITINRLMQSEQQARNLAEGERQRFQTLIENSYEAIALVGADGEILYVSPSVYKMTGYQTSDLVGHNMSEFIFSGDLQLVVTQFEQAILTNEPVSAIEFRYRHEDGSWRWLEASCVNMLDNPGIGGLVINARDVTQKKIAQDTILHQAMHDPLTDLPNRKEMSERLDQCLEIAKRHERKLAVMFLDMDRFKNINDNLGHSVGDTLLKVMANRFKACLRAEDIVSRFGGDEFIIILNEISSGKDAAAAAEKILKAVSLPVQIGTHTLHPSVSIGIAVFPYDGDTRETLKKHADIALYKAKEKGKNCYEFYDTSMDVYNSERFKMEHEFRHALLQNEIVLYYQPIVSIKRKKLLAVEALARWQHPSRGLLLPGEFIPLAEDSGMILELGEYVLRLASAQRVAWESAGLGNFRVSVNASARQFAQTSFPRRLALILQETGMAPAKLELEITESMAMNDSEMTIQNLKELRKMGVRISIDDFGTGHSSLNYLKRFPINSLKIDRSFVRHSITNGQDGGIVRTIISMGHNLNLKVIAEGVETKQQQDFLAFLGCDAIQGFYVHAPMPAEKFPEWLEQFKKKR